MKYSPCLSVLFDPISRPIPHVWAAGKTIALSFVLCPFILIFHLLENAVVVTLLFMVSTGNLSYYFLFLYHIKRMKVFQLTKWMNFPPFFRTLEVNFVAAWWSLTQWRQEKDVTRLNWPARLSPNSSPSVTSSWWNSRYLMLYFCRQCLIMSWDRSLPVTKPGLPRLPRTPFRN